MRHDTRTLLTGLVVLLLAWGVASAQEPTNAPAKPPINPELVLAIKQFQDNPSDAHWKALSKKLQAASYLIPVRNRGDELKPSEDGTTTIKAGVKLAFAVYRGANGMSYLPVHTDQAAIKRWLPQDARTLVLDAPQVWDLVLAGENWDGAFVNPGTEGMVLTRDALQRLKDDRATK